MHTATLTAPARNANAGPHPPPTPASTRAPASVRLRLLAWNFAIFNALRIVSYLPAMWQIVHSGQSDQHSILSWLCFFGANASTGCWAWESNGRRVDAVVAVNAANALMCGSMALVVAWYRWI